MNGESQEFYAASVQEAVDKASKSLGVAPEQVDYAVLDEGSSGFLGIGARDARITVTVPSSPTSSSPVPGVESSSPPSYENNDSAENRESEDLGRSPEEIRALQPEDPVATVSDHPTEEVPEDLILAVDGFTMQVLQRMGFDATVDAFDAGEVIKVDISTEETGLLIGQKGETIDAIQYLMNVVVYKDRPFIKRIVVDTEGYRQRRVEALQGMAHRAARRVQREKRSIDLPPMAASERRVVHVYLKENPNVVTSSEGQEEARRVVISPTD